MSSGWREVPNSPVILILLRAPIVGTGLVKVLLKLLQVQLAATLALKRLTWPAWPRTITDIQFIYIQFLVKETEWQNIRFVWQKLTHRAILRGLSACSRFVLSRSAGERPHPARGLIARWMRLLSWLSVSALAFVDPICSSESQTPTDRLLFYLRAVHFTFCACTFPFVTPFKRDGTIP